MKKLILKKPTDEQNYRRIGYKIDYESVLNPAQYEAVTHKNGPALVIAGAGTGKTRTLVYRVAYLIENSVQPESILLLTFTRKASSEMLRRASSLLDGRCEKVSGGTFHSYALQVLRQYANLLGFESSFSVIDQSDSEDTINLIRNQFKFDKSKKRFPQKNTLQDIYSLAVNKRESLEKIIDKHYPAFIEYINEIRQILNQYAIFKKQHNLMDYDDLLALLLELLKSQASVANEVSNKYRWIMIDEYQDTNRLQHEIVLLLAGKEQNVMAVGDDAQSIYSFRGADFQNILFFPESFNNCTIYKIEENYRSTQPILNLTNVIIKDAIYKYEKVLFTRIVGDEKPKIIQAKDERQQSQFVTQQVLELREQGISLKDIAILFRYAFHSFDLEIELTKANIPFMKFGGLKFIETAHIKDILAYLKIIINPKDAVSWQRVLLLLDGVGPRTASKFTEIITNSDSINQSLGGIENSKELIIQLYRMLEELRNKKITLTELVAQLSDYYKPLLENKYDDWKRRWRDVETLTNITQRYNTINEFLNEITIEPPIESLADMEPESKEVEFITLSTIHSAKGLEWKALLLIWALEGRFPGSKAIDSIDSIEEERRLFYVACTRAKSLLYISYPINIFDRFSGTVLSEPSRFLNEITEDIAEHFILVDEEIN